MPSSLDFLTRDHDTTSARGARRLPAWIFPAAVLLTFALLFFWLFRERLTPGVKVKVGRVLAVPGKEGEGASPGDVPEAENAPGGALFQASGWIEADPFAVRATALIDGVVADVLVREGQSVAKGDLIATLVDEEAKLALAVAEAAGRKLKAQKLAELSGIEAGGSREESLRAEADAAATREDEAADQLRRMEELRTSGAVPQSEVISARLRHRREQSIRAAAEASLREQASEIHRLRAELATKDEEIALAEIAVEQAKLTLARTRITAPMTGRILRLSAAPGDKKMLGMDQLDSSTLAVLFDPARLQVRVDVPLADAARLVVGQKTRIHCAALPDEVFEGEVTRISGEADVQRNTLQVKVRIDKPSDVFRPEMFCRVEFFALAAADAPEGEGKATRGSERLSLWVPGEAVREGNVWVVEPVSQRVSLRAVKCGAETEEDHVRVFEGLNPGELVVTSQVDLQEGQRVTPETQNP